MKLVVVMVGLPARGKSYIASKIRTYLNWLGSPCKVFNVGSYRRKLCGASKPACFFDPHNAVAEGERMRAAKAALDDMIGWMMMKENCVAIYDATNSTFERRRWILENLEPITTLIFIESICNDINVRSFVYLPNRSLGETSKR